MECLETQKGKENESHCCLGLGVHTGKGSRVCIPSGIQGRYSQSAR